MFTPPSRLPLDVHVALGKAEIQPSFTLLLLFFGLADETKVVMLSENPISNDFHKIEFGNKLSIGNFTS